MQTAMSPAIPRTTALYSRVAITVCLAAAVLAGIVCLIFFSHPAAHMNPGNPLSRPMAIKPVAVARTPLIEVAKGDVDADEAACAAHKGSWDDDTQLCTPDPKEGAKAAK